jgi:hypothetical protein
VRLGGIQGLRLLPSRAKIGGRASAPSTLSADATKSGAINVPEENVSSEAIDRFGGGTRPTAHPLHGCLRSELLGLADPISEWTPGRQLKTSAASDEVESPESRHKYVKSRNLHIWSDCSRRRALHQ